MNDVDLAKAKMNLIVDETLNTRASNILHIEESTISSYELLSKIDGFYSLENKSERLDLPVNLAMFDDVTEGKVLEISLYDKTLNLALCDFFNVSGKFRLVKTTSGFFFIHSLEDQEIKKAA